MKKRMRQLTTVNTTLIFKYTCTACMFHEEIRTCTEVGHVSTYSSTYNIITHVRCVQYTALDFTSCGRAITWSSKVASCNNFMHAEESLGPHVIVSHVHEQYRECGNSQTVILEVKVYSDE